MSSVSTVQKPKVLALGYPSFVGEEYIKAFESQFLLDVVVPSSRKQTVHDVAERVAWSGPYDALLARLGSSAYSPFDAEFLQPLIPHCKILASSSAGFDKVDVDWLTKNGMWFCNTRGAVSEATADMAMFLILAVLRDTYRAEKNAREGLWRTNLRTSTDPGGKILGIVGMGSIGKDVARKAAAFNMRIYYYNPTQYPPDIEKQYGATYCSSLSELLSISDVISLHCRLIAETRNMISYKEFSQMKDGVFFVNTARGAIVDEEALIEALKTEKVKRAGLDCFATEPNINPYFLNSENCVIQPHMGGLTDGAFGKAEKECLENIKAFFETGRPIAPVNELSTREAAL
ncbi:MAG: hypothetical protein M1834_003590 [Cirrosporium novae-zelandiae]|nr:MAG: hypothetical protein M1834_003590 [Cirrosporium novae-zelandiae]